MTSPEPGNTPTPSNDETGAVLRPSQTEMLSALENANTLRYVLQAESDRLAQERDDAREDAERAKRQVARLQTLLDDASEIATTCVVILSGPGNMPYNERCARAENELRWLGDRIDGYPR